MKFTFLLLTFSFVTTTMFSQNTVGTLQLDESLVDQGYNLFTPNDQNVTYLIDQCGKILNTWEDNNLARLGADQYLLEDGSLLKAKADLSVVDQSSIGAGGAGGVIEIRSWENELQWQYIIQDSLQRQHHDIHMMPNGNVLAIVWDRYYLDDIASMGFDTSIYPKTELWPDKIVEIDTATSSIVWQWKAWDHMIQDIDDSLPNFGIISEHPELININYQEYTFERKDWMHSNALDYNPDLDQIILSVRNFQEVWIIDHSTTTEQAASHAGGALGMGGDLVYRWGNPQAYGQGEESDRKLFYQHDVSWIDAPDLSDSPYFNMISIFNNFIDDEFSLGVILDPSDIDGALYNLEDGRYLPQEFTTSFSHPDRTKQFSSSASNFQLLPNGNVMLHAARQGRTLELTSDGIPVWEYLIPMRNGVPIEQGVELSLSDNFTFSSRRYNSNFIGFEGKDLSTSQYIELNPNESECMPNSLDEYLTKPIKIYPNPTTDILYLSNANMINDEIVKVYNLLGEVYEIRINKSASVPSLNVTDLPKGVYLIRINNYNTTFVKL